MNPILSLFINAAIFCGIFAYVSKWYHSDTFDVMVDRHGTWRIPTNGTITQLTSEFIAIVPRYNYSFIAYDGDFDMDDSSFLQSSNMYIFFFGAFGVLFFVIFAIILMSRYLCNCCGGKHIPRKGYRESSINFYRYAIICVSFVLIGILIYGYFANTDLHTAVSTLITSFVNVSNEVGEQLVTLSGYLPDSMPTDYNKSLYSTDLNFTSRYASGQGTIMKSYLNSYEILRMVFIIANLVVATVGTSVGIAAGSVRHSTPMIVMVILMTISCPLFFFSFGIHFAGSRMINDFCSDALSYYNTTNEDFLPMRLQYFTPCLNTPLFPFIRDYFSFYAILSVTNFTSFANESNVTEIVENTPQWFNITDDFYDEVVANLTANASIIAEALSEARNVSAPLRLIDKSQTCRWTKNQLRLDSFLLCTYSKDNLDMLMISQAVGAILVVILAILGFPAIKRFKYAGNANLQGVLDANHRFMGKKAKPRRKA